jgi:hypothetical protein
MVVVEKAGAELFLLSPCSLPPLRPACLTFDAWFLYRVKVGLGVTRMASKQLEVSRSLSKNPGGKSHCGFVVCCIIRDLQTL